MRTKTVLTALALLSLPVPRAQAAAAPSIVIRAARSGWVDVTMTHPFSFPQDIQPTMSLNDSRYVGFLAEPLSSGNPVDDVKVRSEWGFASVHIGGGTYVQKHGGSSGVYFNGQNHPTDVDFPAGKYRLHVFTERPVEIAFPVNGVDGRVVLTVRTRSTVQFVTSSMSVAAGAQGAIREPFALTRRSSVLEGLDSHIDGNGFIGTECVHATATGLCAGQQAPDVMGGAAASSTNSHDYDDGVWYLPGTLAAGAYEGYQDGTSFGTWSPVNGFVLAFDTPAT
jgi:hypothetical protein